MTPSAKQDHSTAKNSAADAAGHRDRHRPAFLITIDTEGDNLWSRPSQITTHNADYLPRFQSVCERYSLKPTYLTNWEMACSERFVEFGRDVQRRGAGEIGMHLHAWNSPPLVPLTEDDYFHQPYLTEYPAELLQQKVRQITDKLEGTFGVKMASHRGGRWGFDEVYAGALVENGYRVDCSVTPRMSWKSHLGAPHGQGGPDYRTCPEHAYFLDEADITRCGRSGLLEVPMTVMPRRPARLRRWVKWLLNQMPTRRCRRAVRSLLWLTPPGHGLKQMLSILSRARADRRDYVQLTVHSSELMPGGSPTYPDSESIEHLYRDLEALFDAARNSFVGMTLAEFCSRFRANERNCALSVNH